MAGENIVTINEENFGQEVTSSTVPVLLDFWAEWCGPCLRAAPILDELAQEYNGRVKIGKVNVEENQELTLKFDIRGIPAFFVIKGGEVVDRLEGARKDLLKGMIERAIA